MAKKQRTFISIEIDPERKNAFATRLEKEGKTVTEVLKDFIDNYLGKEEPLPLDLVVADLQKRVEMLEQRENQANAQLLGESVA